MEERLFRERAVGGRTTSRGKDLGYAKAKRITHVNRRFAQEETKGGKAAQGRIVRVGAVLAAA